MITMIVEIIHTIDVIANTVNLRWGRHMEDASDDQNMLMKSMTVSLPRMTIRRPFATEGHLWIG